MSDVKYTRGGCARPATSLQFHTGSWRVQRPVHRHGAAPCHVACPAGENPQAYLARIEEGDEQAAWRELVTINPLPAITGRVCPHFCESACNRATYDSAISIHGVERYLGDKALAHDWHYAVPARAVGAARVAIVGAGPAGLAAAYHLTLLGYQAVMFEANPEPGGTLRGAIPEYRLPRGVLQVEMQRVLDIGIEFRANTRLGRDVSLEELRQSHAAVFLGPGTQRARYWHVDGIVQRDLHQALDLLKAWNTVGKLSMPASVAVVGAGNTALDTARILRRAGVASVHLVAHKALPEQAASGDDVMPVHPREIAQALEEGVQIHPHRGIRRLLLRGERVVGVEMVHMKKLRGADGVYARVAFEGTETVLHVEQVIPAIGQTVDGVGFDALVADNGFVSVNAQGAVTAGYQGVFAGGDAIGKGGTVTRAIGDGRRAAAAIHGFLQGREWAASVLAPVTFAQLNVNYFEPAPRPEDPVLALKKRIGEKEVVGGIEQQAVLQEAQRCFSCGNCFACDNCWTLCPDTAVLKTQELAADGAHYVFDYDYCKGCGICAQECPCGFIAMEAEL